METTDRRRLRGDRTRAAVLRRAVDVASLDGLERVSFGGLAADTGISKAGAQTLFGTKEALQLLVVEQAARMFGAAVVEPAMVAERGEARLRALIERWIGYAEEPLFAGGCFWVANLPDYDSRPGPVRDALVAQRRRWLSVLEGELRAAVERGEIADPDVELTAFGIDAVLSAANTAMRLGEPDVPDRVRRAVGRLVGAGAARPR